MVRSPAPAAAAYAALPPQAPAWLRDGFAPDDLAMRCEATLGAPHLRTGRAPAVGQRVSAAIDYVHDGSHPATYSGAARVIGEVTEVLPPPPRGVYVLYPGEEVGSCDSAPAQTLKTLS